jgi:hypothetical protein
MIVAPDILVAMNSLQCGNDPAGLPSLYIIPGCLDCDGFEMHAESSYCDQAGKHQLMERS